jgi:hypothetical protein
VYPFWRHGLGMAAALWVAATCALAADSVVVIDVTGKWERVSAAGQSLTRYQHLPVRDRIRFVISEPFVPGTLVLADSTGTLYYSKECKSREPCDGVLEVPPVPPKTVAVDAGPSLLKRLFKPITDFMDRDENRPVILIGDHSPQGGILSDTVVALNGDSVDLCDSVGAMNHDRYSVELSAPSGARIAGQLNWTGACPALVMLPNLTPGPYTMKAVDSHGTGDTAVVLVCSRDRYAAASKEFREIADATRSWLQPGSEGFAVQASARRGFLTGYLLWLRIPPDATPVSNGGKRNR